MDVEEGGVDENEQVKSEKSSRPLTEVELKPRIVLRIRKKCIVEKLSDESQIEPEPIKE